MLLDKNRINTLLLFLVTIFICFMIGEFGVRMIFKDSLIFKDDERNLIYRHDSILGWFPIENSKNSYTATRRIDIEHNSRGFRDGEHILNSDFRILFLGDSFVWGYDVNESERFTEILEAMLPNLSIYNLGISGYGTDQEYLLLQQQYDFYRPNIVFLVFCTDNDEADNAQNNRYGGYYKPYYSIDNKNLELKGTPVPKSDNYFFINHKFLARSYLVRLFAKAFFRLKYPLNLELENPTYEIIRNINRFSINKGFKFIVGLQEEAPGLEQFLTNIEIDYITLSNPYKYPSNGKHWTPEGHVFVAKRIYEFLTRHKDLTTESTIEKTN